MKLFVTCAVVSAFVPAPRAQVPACSPARRDVRAAAWRGSGNERLSFGQHRGKSFARVRREDPGYCAWVLEQPAPSVSVEALGDSSVNLAVRPYAKPDDYWDVYFGITEACKEALDAAGITIPFPQRDVHMAPQAESTPAE